MEPSLINLLPSKRVHLFRQEYFFRLAVTALVLGASVVLIHGVLLIPAYTYLEQQIITREARLKGLDDMQTPEQQALTAQVALFEKNASRLKQLETTASGSDVLRTILSLPHGGVSLSGFTFTPDQGASTYRLLITGDATTRDSLRQYDNTLSALPFVSSVDLPIGAYAKETNIPFTLTLVGTTP